MRPKWYPAGIALLLLAVIALIYWRVFHYSFIYDDWAFLHSIIFKGGARFLRDSFSPFDKVTYRPIGAVYFVTLYSLFGQNPFYSHAIGLLIHFCNALLVVWIVYHISEDMYRASIVGLLYAAAVSVHMEPLLWMSGFYDTGGVFFFLLSMALFMKNRAILSAIAFSFALLTKESTVILPAILLLYMFLVEPFLKGVHPTMRRAFFGILPHMVLLGIYAGLKSAGLSPFMVPEGHPFRVALAGPHVLDNCVRYLRWAFDSATSLSDATISLIGLSAAVVPTILFLIVSLWTTFQKGRDDEHHASFQGGLFWLGWFVCGLIPVLFLPNHGARYFLTCSLPGFLALGYYVWEKLFTFIGFRQRVIKGIAAVTVVLSISSSAYFFERRETVDVDAPTIDGMYALIQKGKQADAVEHFLMQSHPALPDHSILVGNHLNPRSIADGLAPQVWYRDTTLHFYNILDVHSDSIGPFVDPRRGLPAFQADPSPGRRPVKAYLDSSKTVVLIHFRGATEDGSFSELRKRME
jgi:hypothetical protein